MRNALLPALALIGLGACAETSFSFTPAAPGQRVLQPVPWNRVGVYLTKRPAREYSEIGLLEGETSMQETTVNFALRLRDYAATKGCEGVVLMGMGEKSDAAAIAFLGPLAENKRSIQAVCIVYKGAGPQSVPASTPGT